MGRRCFGACACAGTFFACLAERAIRCFCRLVGFRKMGFGFGAGVGGLLAGGFRRAYDVEQLGAARMHGLRRGFQRRELLLHFGDARRQCRDLVSSRFAPLCPARDITSDDGQALCALGGFAFQAFEPGIRFARPRARLGGAGSLGCFVLQRDQCGFAFAQSFFRDAQSFIRFRRGGVRADVVFENLRPLGFDAFMFALERRQVIALLKPDCRLRADIGRGAKSVPPP
jgi:hypothetical protein